MARQYQVQLPSTRELTLCKGALPSHSDRTIPYAQAQLSTQRSAYWGGGGLWGGGFRGIISCLRKVAQFSLGKNHLEER